MLNVEHFRWLPGNMMIIIFDRDKMHLCAPCDFKNFKAMQEERNKVTRILHFIKLQLKWNAINTEIDKSYLNIWWSVLWYYDPVSKSSFFTLCILFIAPYAALLTVKLIVTATVNEENSETSHRYLSDLSACYSQSCRPAKPLWIFSSEDYQV